MSSVVVNESVIRKLLEDPSMNQLGCLKSGMTSLPIAQQKRKCGKCGKKRGLVSAVSTTPSLGWAKRCIYNMADDALKQIKTFLGVERLVFYFSEPGLPQRIVR